MTDDLIQLVRRAQTGDQVAWRALVHQYQTAAQRVVYTILGNQEDVEDALQDSWLLATQKSSMLRDPARFGPWFYRIVANAALRKRQQLLMAHW